MMSFVSIPQFIPHFCGIASSLREKSEYPAIPPAKMTGLSCNSCRKRAVSPFLSLKWWEAKALRGACPQSGVIPPASIADTFPGWKEAEKLSHIIGLAELKENDYNISPTRYIHTSDAETYRPISEIVGELDVIEIEARETDKAMRGILEKIEV